MRQRQVEHVRDRGIEQLTLRLHERAQSRADARIKLSGPNLGWVFVENFFDQLDLAAEILKRPRCIRNDRLDFRIRPGVAKRRAVRDPQTGNAGATCAEQIRHRC